MLLQTVTLLLNTLLLVSAHPLSRPRYALSASAITTVSPSTSTCSGAPFPEECATASQAAGPISRSFTKYQITSSGEQAALLALMLYESGDFKYSKNHFPGVPGQGTRNMQSPAFNLKYAESLYPAEEVEEAQAQGPEAVLELVNDDEKGFASAAWFLSTQCTDEIRQGLASKSAEGWTAYLTQCIGTTDNAERDAYWKKAVQALE
ncbi:hypothetical protein GQ43DRAFT_196852 [Delitschia confertaspora ATCC 74209]|uniref:Uncharacterized protein n=1 Tax=Delitschia confertaspora ATCC 74209 TaxID=1513339 RepID=A0A9P4MUZ4_9PLEO|nr:hypothetical protein GQ43DRAFT_196852 [Delitschia confertaspora ATCC 74209]